MERRFSSHMIRGDWMEDGYLAGRDTLPVEISGDNVMRDPETHETLTLTQYGNDAPVIKSEIGVWTFLPDDSELERLRIPVLRIS